MIALSEPFPLRPLFPYRRNVRARRTLCYGAESRDRKPREFLHAEIDAQSIRPINVA
jgi:hypothetical protein